jgi:deoxyribodipyrimidine photo-lyase
MSLAVVWFRRDLRLRDNPALAHALANHERVVALYVHAPHEDEPWSLGAASRWWLHHALADLDRQLRGRLVLRRGSSVDELCRLVDSAGAAAVYWNRLYEPAAIARDTAIKRDLRARGIAAESFAAALLFEPWRVLNRQGKPFRVFTPFWKQLLAQGLPKNPVSVGQPEVDNAVVDRTQGFGGVALAELDLLPNIGWDQGISAAWRVSREAAEARLDEFVATELERYDTGRDLPATDQVSRLSPYLHFGQIGPREIVAACRDAGGAASPFLRELGWREFAAYQLYHFPSTCDEPLDGRFERFAWREDAQQLAAWQRGMTGVPLVDAGMRQLWQTGWMHNRVRMIVASFLTKNLLLPWQQGARWFWDTLVDADLASNTLGWQWTAGCGADAAPYFRVFNPVLQGERFDKDGAYVRRWLPELDALADRWVHQPWAAPADVLRKAGIRLGGNYPAPLVDLKASRERALAAWGAIR